jgi:hypothetical protein
MEVGKMVRSYEIITLKEGMNVLFMCLIKQISISFREAFGTYPDVAKR